MSKLKFLKRLFKRKNKQEVNGLTTLEEVRKAYEDLSEDDKKSFHQSIADRVHESIAAQEREDGNEDSQSAEAREHEALGEEHAQGEGDVSELHESDDTAEEKREDERDGEQSDDKLAAILARLDALEARNKSEDESEEKAAERMRQTYGIGNGVFQGDGKGAPEKQITKEEIAKKIAKIM